MAAPKDTISDRRLSRALAHVNNLWFPFNPAVIKQLEEGFRSSLFLKEPESLLTLLKQDFALFTYIIKELIPIGSAEKIAPAVICNPVELLKWAGPDRIKTIVFSEKGLPSAHSLHSSEDFQADRLRETAIIASTAEVLSEKKNLDPDMGFCRGVLREIGLNLIAWNYPLLYTRIIKSIPETSSLDEELTRELGFSPTVLAMRIITPSHINMENPELSSLNKEFEVYDSLCKVGEALAHADRPELYPTAENDWLSAREFILQTVGTGGIEEIQSKALSHSKGYAQEIPASFENLKEFNPEKKISQHKQAMRSCDNRYVKFCDPALQDAIRSLYAEMPADAVNRKVLERLIKEVIPQAGFTGGCVFVIDPAALTLSPRTMIGKVRARPIATITLRPSALSGLELGVSETEIIEAATEHEDAIANAFACIQPIIERDEGAQSGSLTTISSSLGGRRRIGVLYLEKPSHHNHEQDSATLSTFKALRQALCDALHLD